MSYFDIYSSYNILYPHIHLPYAGKTMLRQQLQQYLRNQHHALRGFGDYLRRNLRTILELAMDKAEHAGGEQQISPREVDRISFLMQPPRSRQGEHGRHGGGGVACAIQDGINAYLGLHGAYWGF